MIPMISNLPDLEQQLKQRLSERQNSIRQRESLSDAEHFKRVWNDSSAWTKVYPSNSAVEFYS